jgi:type II secretory ATPase GspE/PulE/Tfp pilus assembly ATPase PilB-like protein
VVILVTGPTGSGKTTTLYAALNELDTVTQNVLTIEDPIEYQLPNIGQIQVKPKIGLTFAQGLRHILRQDPDVILVGEIRDLETAEICVRSSLTGHLVFSTLHTNDAVSAMIRLVDMGIPPYLLSASVRAVLAQRLVRRLCPACRSPLAAGADDGLGLGEAMHRLVGKTVYRPRGCPACLGGYAGRIGIYELMIIDVELREGVRQGVALNTLADLAVERGMITLVDDGMQKILDGVTSLAELQRAVGHLG